MLNARTAVYQTCQFVKELCLHDRKASNVNAHVHVRINPLLIYRQAACYATDPLQLYVFSSQQQVRFAFVFKRWLTQMLYSEIVFSVQNQLKIHMYMHKWNTL